MKNDKVSLEDYLRGYIVENLKKDKEFEKLFVDLDDIEWYANNIPYHISQKNIDIILFHRNFRYTNSPLRYKYSIVELKKDIVKPLDISQLVRYSMWASGRLANGEVEMIQPVLIGYEFSEDAIKKSRNSDFNDRGIILAKYRVLNEKKIDFQVI